MPYRYWNEQIIKLGTGTILALVNIAVLLSIPYLFKITIDSVLPRQDWTALIMAGLAIIGLHLSATILILLSRRLTLNATKEVISRLRNDLIRRLLYGSLDQYTKMNRGQVYSRMLHDTEGVDIMLNALALSLIHI